MKFRISHPEIPTSRRIKAFITFTTIYNVTFIVISLFERAPFIQTRP